MIYEKVLLKNGSSTSTLIEIKACEELPLGQKKHTNILNKTRETVFKLEGAKLSEITMVSPILIVVVVLITASIGPYIGTSFALHDSTLGVNTWLASDNSTQLNTIDLLCAVNTNPAVPTSIPIIINILPRFFLSMPFCYHRLLFLGFGAKCSIVNKCQNWLFGLSFAIPTPFIIS